MFPNRGLLPDCMGLMGTSVPKLNRGIACAALHVTDCTCQRMTTQKRERERERESECTEMPAGVRECGLARYDAVCLAIPDLIRVKGCCKSEKNIESPSLGFLLDHCFARLAVFWPVLDSFR